ncbi:MAG TPA: hypothetical protein VK960_07890, partial [Acidimicrobiia bacterium]|nr:hypothetical protein [Acidimicrobiia bacterium]
MRRLAALLMVGALVLTLAPAAWSGEDDAALAVVPGSGLAGSTATVEGSEWTNAGLTVEIHWDDWDGPLLATVVTELVGSDPGFSTDITIPANATPGTYTIRACVTGPGYPECDDTTHEFHEGATGSFTVDAPPTTTVATTTTSTTTTTVADATTTTVGDGGFVIPDDLSL